MTRGRIASIPRSALAASLGRMVLGRMVLGRMEFIASGKSAHANSVRLRTSSAAQTGGAMAMQWCEIARRRGVQRHWNPIVASPRGIMT